MFSSNKSTAKVPLVEKREEEKKKGLFTTLRDNLTSRFKQSTATIPPIEKTEQEKKKDFIQALKRQDLAEITSYINQENFDVNEPLEIEELTTTTTVQQTPLETVLRAEKVKPEVLRALMEKGAKLEPSKPDKFINLAHAICKREKIINKHDVIKTLSEREEFVEQLKIKNPDDESTVLHSLAQDHHSQQEAIEFLVREHGLNVNERDYQGNTPLHLARRVHNAIALTNSGANYQLKNNNYSTPLDMEIENYDSLGAGEIKFREMVTAGKFPITFAVINQELSTNGNKSLKEIERILLENTKESNHPFLTGQRTFRSGQPIQLDKIYQRASSKIPYFSLKEKNNSKTTSVDWKNASEQSEKTVEKSSVVSETSIASVSIQSREKKDRYARCAWFNPVAGPSSAFEQRKQKELQEQAVNEKKEESQARPSYS